MAILKCPGCGLSAESPDDEGRCFRCDLPLEAISLARPKRDPSRQRRGILIGALVGLIVVSLLGLAGGAIGMAVVGGVAGAILGLVVGFVEGLIGGIQWSVLMADGSWMSYWAKTCTVGGFLVGAYFGARGDFSVFGQAPVIACAAIGGLALGALIGLWLMIRNRRPPESA